MCSSWINASIIPRKTCIYISYSEHDSRRPFHISHSVRHHSLGASTRQSRQPSADVNGQRSNSSAFSHRQPTLHTRTPPPPLTAAPRAWGRRRSGLRVPPLLPPPPGVAWLWNLHCDPAKVCPRAAMYTLAPSKGQGAATSLV